ncbi:hypothetical protein FOVSG1_012195 [Fusarium oxysporum f. sp. vasinfectum]
MSSLMHSKVLKGFTFRHLDPLPVATTLVRTQRLLVAANTSTILDALARNHSTFARNRPIPQDLPSRQLRFAKPRPSPRLICVSIPPTLGLKKSSGQSGQSGFVGGVSDTTRNK